jgi:hypothetical protein
MACSGKCACGGIEQTVSVQPAFLNYCVMRGDRFADTVTIKEFPGAGLDPEPVDLTSPARTFVGQLRKAPNSPVIVYEFDIDMTDAASGSFVFSIPASITSGLTGEYHYDIEQTAQPSTEPRTILAGVITFSPDVTR